MGVDSRFQNLLAISRQSRDHPLIYLPKNRYIHQSTPNLLGNLEKEREITKKSKERKKPNILVPEIPIRKENSSSNTTSTNINNISNTNIKE